MIHIMGISEDGKTVLAQGHAYDLFKTLTTMAHLANQLMVAFQKRDGQVAVEWKAWFTDSYEPFTGKDVYKRMGVECEKLKADYDIADMPIVFRIADIKVLLHPFGAQHLYVNVMGKIVLAGDGEATRLDTEPVIYILPNIRMHGPGITPQPVADFHLKDPAREIISDVLDANAGKGIAFLRDPDGLVTADCPKIRFLHAHYADIAGMLRIRCEHVDDAIPPELADIFHDR